MDCLELRLFCEKLIILHPGHQPYYTTYIPNNCAVCQRMAAAVCIAGVAMKVSLTI